MYHMHWVEILTTTIHLDTLATQEHQALCVLHSTDERHRLLHIEEQHYVTYTCKQQQEFIVILITGQEL